MGISKLKVVFNSPDKVFYPGQMVSGRVEFLADKIIKVKGVELKLKGRAKCKLDKEERYRDADGHEHTRSVPVKESETYLKNEMRLAGGKGEFELPVGEHQYPFSIVLPYKCPSTFNGSHGSIQYYAKAKIDIPWAIDPTEKEHFTVRNLLNLNMYPNLKNSFKDEKSKTFCCLCCASGPLTIAIHIPKTGFARNESIPITLEIDNASNVSINSVKTYLERKINFTAQGEHREDEAQLAKLLFGAVGEGQSQTFSENLTIPNTDFPNIEECRIITITHRLHIEADASGMHSDLDIKVPLTIGDIALCDNENAALAQYPQGYPMMNQQYNPGVPYQPGMNPAPYPGNPQMPMYQGMGIPGQPMPVPGQVMPVPTQSYPPPQMPGPPNPQMPMPGYPNSQIPMSGQNAPPPGVYPNISSANYSQSPYPTQGPPPPVPSSYPVTYTAAGDCAPPVQPAMNPEFTGAQYPGEAKPADIDLKMPSFGNHGVQLQQTNFLSNSKSEDNSNQFTPLLPSLPSAPPSG